MQHSEIQEQIPLYAFGGMPAEESARLMEHLAVCPACRALLNEYRFVADEMLLQVPARTAPTRIGTRLQELIKASGGDARRIVPGVRQKNAGVRSGVNAQSERGRAVPPTRGPRRFWNQPLNAPRWAFALTAIAFLLLLGVGGVLAYQNQTRTAATAQVLQLLSGRNIKYVELTAAMSSSENNGFLCLQADNATGLLWLYNLQPLDHDHVYQVWLRNDTLHDTGGTFRPDYDGRAIAIIRAPRPLSEYKEIGITIEPATGSQAPTTPRVVGGKVD